MALALGIVALGCGDDIKPIKRDRPSRGPVQPASTKSTPLPDLSQPIDHSPTMVAAPPPGYLVDAKVLVISADGSDSQLDAIEQTLRYLGTPFDLLIASQAATLTAAQLGTAMHGKYNAIILTTGNLVLSGGGSAFSAAEFATLANYEATFQVRRASLYTSPDAGYGYSSSVSQDTQAAPLATQCTTAGRAVFPYVNCSNGVTISGAFAYRATPSDGATVPLLTDSSGRALAATRAYGDGREALSLNFQQSPTLVHSLQILHGVISWATRGVFLGERHAYLRDPDRRLLSPRRHLHGRHLPDERGRCAGRVRLADRQARPGGDGRHAVPHGLQRRRGQQLRRADDQVPANRERVQLDQPHVGPHGARIRSRTARRCPSST